VDWIGEAGVVWTGLVGWSCVDWIGEAGVVWTGLVRLEWCGLDW
jgi:hypothetical protein